MLVIYIKGRDKSNGFISLNFGKFEEEKNLKHNIIEQVYNMGKQCIQN